MKKQTCNIKVEIPKAVNVVFPIYRLLAEGEKGCGDWYAEYWKIESKSKITIIKESMLEMAVVTYDDKEVDFFYEHVTEEMLKEENGWEIITEHLYDSAFNRLIDKITNA